MEKFFFEAVKSYDQINIPNVGSFSWNNGNPKFDSFSTYHDGKFLKFLKEELKWENEKATSLSSKWFNFINDELRDKKSFMFKGYGTLMIQDDKLVFNNQIKYKKSKILLFGLLSILFASLSIVLYLMTVQKEIVDEDITVSFVKSTEITAQNQDTSILSELDTDSIEILNTIIPNPELTKSGPLIELQNKYEDQYIIIAGTFSQKSNAIGLYETLIQNERFQCKIIYNGHSLYWVSVYISSEKSAAKSFLESNKINGWIKKI